VEINDPRTIRALAHPLRLDLLGVLGAGGPATAAQCGRILGVSQASCSFHLRQLAKYGLVEDAGPGSDKRERRWQAAAARLRVHLTPDSDSLVERQLGLMVLEREMHAIAEYSQLPDGTYPQWQGKAGVVAAMAMLSPDEAAELKEQWLRLLAPYIARARANGAGPKPGQEYVRYFLAATPFAAAQPTGPDIMEGEQE
jgi:DNA-binding transcriptional ArsR family regulator